MEHEETSPGGPGRFDEARSVLAAIRFLAPVVRKPVFHEGCDTADYLPLETHEVWIENARLSAGRCSLEEQGFLIVRRSSAVVDFLSAAGRQQYLREVEQLIVDLTGAVKAVALANGVIRRSERASGHRRDGTTVPGRFAHCDFSPNPAGSRFWVESLLGADEARARLGGRFALYNVWRPLSAPPQDTPLALCDARSVARTDAVGCDQILCQADGRRIEFELSVFRYSPAQRWCYFPDMGSDEVLVFRGFDSDPRRAGGVPHAAFDAPGCAASARPRESIDERVIAFYD
ncbi:MAG TPA: CmcJ/NvfI family oxidoreductase [Steroidobacteraceae bacterium]|nr:CmcJ/NvfI family oxidoreductase [Steroidobacteraceae bacterium]